jgi:hydrogenase-4 component B
MSWFLIALAVLLLGGLLAWAAGGNSTVACWIGAGSAVLGNGLAMLLSVGVLYSGQSLSLRMPWSVPFGSANMEIDPLSAVFAAAISLVALLAAVYGSQYLRMHAVGQSPGVSWLFFNVLAASMLMVVAARNGVLFLMSWELMSLASFFVVIGDDEKEDVRRVGWLYLVAMHLGTAFLLALFLLLGRNAPSLDFDQFSTAAAPSGVLFLLALIGFGTKAGFIPMHVWLPEAHPAAPSHVSAVMSGVMIKTGIYGLLRVLTLLGLPPAWWGWTLLAVGLVSGVLGVLYALSQHDLKRLLAYHSVENVGIIAIGLGVGLLGISYANPAMAVLGFTGGLLHVVNHAIFKSLLFLGAGAVLQTSGTGEMDRLGGLLKRMPVTAATFLIGAAAISGLPPLNGFVSEFLIYLGALNGLAGSTAAANSALLLSVSAVGGLALIGGLAAACFTKAFGITFLGEPRSEEAARAHEPGAAMRWSMIALAGLCVAIGLTAPLWPWVLQPAVAVCLQHSSVVGHHVNDTAVASAIPPLIGLMTGSYVVLGLIVVFALLRRRLLRGRRVEQTVTWDCGYVAPSPRMQYTASSFARPLVWLFRIVLRSQDDIRPPRELFPRDAALETHAPDLFRRYVYEPLFLAIAGVAARLRWLQEGRIQIYVLYIAITILVLLIWKLG